MVVNAFWSPDHPVLTLLRSRREQGSRPGARTDPWTLALAVEGGGMRGIVSAAMLCAIEDLGFAGAVDAVYGGSSGSLNAAYFLAGDIGRNLSIYTEDLASRSFIDLRRFARGRPVLDIDWAFDHVLAEVKPLEYDAILTSPVRLHVSVVLVDRIDTVWPDEFTDRDDLRQALRAGAWLPILTQGVAEFRGQPAIDGGVLVAHPATRARAEHTHVLSLSTRTAGPPRMRPTGFQRYVGRHLDALRPGLGRGYLDSLVVYARERTTMNRERTEPVGPPYVLDLSPPAGALTVRRHASDPVALLAVARTAYEVMAFALTGRHRPAFVRLAVHEDS